MPLVCFRCRESSAWLRGQPPLCPRCRLSLSVPPARPLLVGQAPGPAGIGPDGPLGDRIGRKLAALAGISYRGYLCRFERRNLLSAEPERRPLAVAEAAARDLPTAACTILLGQVVARAFGVDTLRVPALTWVNWAPPREGVVAWAPHPSGRNRWYNDREHGAALGRLLRSALDGEPAAVYTSQQQRGAELDRDVRDGDGPARLAAPSRS